MKLFNKNLILIIAISLSSTNSMLAMEEINPNENLLNKKDYLIRKEKKIGPIIEIPIKIEDIEKLLVNNNLELKSEKLKLEQHKLILKSKLSAWYPNLSLTSNGLPKYLDGYTNNSSNNTLSRQISTSIAAEVKWDLVNPLRKPEIDIARNKFKKSQIFYLIKFREIKLKALKNYYLLQQAKEEVEVAKKSVDYSRTGVGEAQIRLDVGIGTKLELLEAKTQLSRDMKILTNKIGQQKIKQRILTNILNLPPNRKASIGTEAKIKGLWRKTIEESLIAAYNFSKELDNIILDISIDNNNAKISDAARKPTITIYNNLKSSLNKGQTLVESPDMSYTSSSINNTIGITANWKLIDGGKSKSLYLYNKKKAKVKENEFKLKLLSIQKEVEESFFNLQTSRENILTTKQEVETAEESLKLTKLRFKEGLTTQREVVNHQRDLIEAKFNDIESITNYNIYISELIDKTGVDKIETCQSNYKTKIKQSKTSSICKL